MGLPIARPDVNAATGGHLSRPPANQIGLRLTSNGGASNGDGGASGDESPNIGDAANRGDANPSLACPIPGDGRGPSAPRRAKDDQPRRRW